MNPHAPGRATIGNFLSQELAIATGAVDLMFSWISPPVHYAGTGATDGAVPYQLVHHSGQGAHRGGHACAVRRAPCSGSGEADRQDGIDNFPNRRRAHPKRLTSWSSVSRTSTFNYALGGFFAALPPAERRGNPGPSARVAGVVGCNNARTCQDYSHDYIVRELIKNDVLVVMTGCGALACAKYGLLCLSGAACRPRPA